MNEVGFCFGIIHLLSIASSSVSEPQLLVASNVTTCAPALEDPVWSREIKATSKKLLRLFPDLNNCERRIYQSKFLRDGDATISIPPTVLLVLQSNLPLNSTCQKMQVQSAKQNGACETATEKTVSSDVDALSDQCQLPYLASLWNFLKRNASETNGPNQVWEGNICELYGIFPYEIFEAQKGSFNCALSTKAAVPRPISCTWLAFIQPSANANAWSYTDVRRMGQRIHCIPSQKMSKLPGLKYAIERNEAEIFFSKEMPKSSERYLLSAIIDANPDSSYEYLLSSNLLHLLPSNRLLDLFTSYESCQIENLANLTLLKRSPPQLLAVTLKNDTLPDVGKLLLHNKVTSMLAASPPFAVKDHWENTIHRIYTADNHVDIPDCYLTELLNAWIRMTGLDWLNQLYQSSNPTLRSLILGLQCYHTKELNHMQVIALTKLYTEEFRKKESSILISTRELLKVCMKASLTKYVTIKTKALSSKPSKLLEGITTSEIDAIGQYFLSMFSANDIQDIYLIEARITALEKIAALSMPDLMLSYNIGNLTSLSLALWNESRNIKKEFQLELKAFGSLAYFLPIDELARILTAADVRTNLGNGFGHSLVCISDDKIQEWENFLIQLFGYPSSWSATDLMGLQNAVVLLPLERLRQMNESELRLAAPYVMHKLKYFQENENGFDGDFITACTKWLKKNGLPSSAFSAKVTSLHKFFFETITGAASPAAKSRQKRDLQEERENLDIAFNNARLQWRHLYDNNLLSDIQQAKAKILFKRFADSITERQRSILNLKASLSGEEVQQVLQDRATSGQLSPREEQTLKEVSAELKLQFLKEVEIILGQRFLLENEPRSTVNIERSGFRPSTITETFGTTESTLETIQQFAEFTTTKKSTEVTDEPIFERNLNQEDKFFHAESKADTIDISLNRYALNAGILSKVVEKVHVEALSPSSLLDLLDVFGEVKFQDSEVSSIIWKKLHETRFFSEKLSPLKITQLGFLLREMSTEEFATLINPTELIAQDWGYEAIEAMANHFIPSNKIRLMQSFSRHLSCSQNPLVNVRMLLVSLRNAICYFRPQDLNQIFLDCPNLYRDVAVHIGDIETCPNLDTLRVLLNFALENYGPIPTWTSTDVSFVGSAVAAMTSQELALLQRLPNGDVPLQGLTETAFRLLDQVKLDKLSLEQKDAIWFLFI